MKIGIIGSGVVVQVLGKAFLTKGHNVMIGTRNTQKVEVVKWKEENAQGNTGTFEEAADYGELIFLCYRRISYRQELLALFKGIWLIFLPG